MTYDLSNNEIYHECPTSDICTLQDQVKFYIGTYQAAGDDDDDDCSDCLMADSL